VGGGSSPLSSEVFLPLPLSQAFLLLITGRCCCSCQLPCLFTVHMRSGSSVLSCGVFLSLPLSQAFPLLVAGRTPPLPPEPLRPARLVYLQSREGFLSPYLWRSVCPTLFPVCLYCSYCLLLSFSFFPQVEVSLSRGLCCSHPGLSVGVPQYHEAHMVRVFPSRLGAGDWRPRDPLGFSVYREVEILSTSWGCGGIKVMPFLSDYACKVCLRCLSKISL
jgi:hypothetical protein